MTSTAAHAEQARMNVRHGQLVHKLVEQAIEEHQQMISAFGFVSLRSLTNAQLDRVGPAVVATLFSRGLRSHITDEKMLVIYR